MLSTGFDPAILTHSRLQTYALDRTVTGIGFTAFYSKNKNYCCCLGKVVKLRPMSKKIVLYDFSIVLDGNKARHPRILCFFSVHRGGC
jgi:hypothetical protein